MRTTTRPAERQRLLAAPYAFLRELQRAVTARWRGQVTRFEIGRAFRMSDLVWICTDVGSRTICAVRLDDLLASGDIGPPYSIVECVIDRYDMDACEPLDLPPHL